MIFILSLVLLTPASAADTVRLRREAREHLAALIAFDTSNPPGNEVVAARYLKEVLARDGIDSKILTSSGTRASLVARLTGTGAKKPLILMCHTDVVPADASQWSTPPFQAVEKDGYLYGRGAADVKSMCAVHAAVLAHLKRAGVRLARDLIFFAEADEESGGSDRHIDWLMRAHPEEFDAEFAINEGGRTVMEEGGKVTEIRVQAAEKTYLDLTLVAKGPSGHASVPKAGNAVAALARAVTRIAEHRFPASVNPVARGFLEHRLALEDGETKELLRKVLKAEPGPELDALAERLAEHEPEYAAMLRDTFAPTILKAGYKSNVIPEEARAVGNARLMPGRAVKDFLADLERIVDDPRVAFEYAVDSGPPVGPMPVDSAMFPAVRAAAAEVFPEAAVVPFLAVWSTDSLALRQRGVLVYGIDPPVTDDDDSRVHGVDERLHVESFERYTEMMLKLVVALGS